MEDGELDYSMDSLFDEIMKDMHACTHTHTCNPPGPDNEHTHTCVHVHTKIVPGPSEEKTTTDDAAECEDKKSKRRPLGNREAVRKYREKKKALSASLEEEVVRLRAVNQQLVKMLKGQASLEAEVARLKCLLVDIRGRIDREIGCFPYQKPDITNMNGGYVMNQCNVSYNDHIYRSYPAEVGNVHGYTPCELDDHQCPFNPNVELAEFPACDASVSKSRKGGGNASRS